MSTKLSKDQWCLIGISTLLVAATLFLGPTVWALIVGNQEAESPRKSVTTPPDDRANLLVAHARFIHSSGVPAADIPGIAICPSMDAYYALNHWYVRRWEDTYRNQVTHGLSDRMEGTTPEPSPETLGCSIVQSGTTLWVDRSTIFSPAPLITTVLPDGTKVSGVTYRFCIEFDAASQQWIEAQSKMIADRRRVAEQRGAKLQAEIDAQVETKRKQEDQIETAKHDAIEKQQEQEWVRKQNADAAVREKQLSAQQNLMKEQWNRTHPVQWDQIHHVRDPSN